ncbi:TetR/AcrR family transcriptional regulator [Polaromonas jejuensis]|uniref:TetR/AcrR family transcriptional regulator n=1 Tax=Polaromonas jejuensis TaxID=457502 RepID=A0ABW0QHQ7_9BURK|nr:TetR/AcrR family transcriptional regulator [Polaromonas jejuensis]
MTPITIANNSDVDTPLAYRDVLLLQSGQEGLRKGIRTEIRIRWAACALLEELALSGLKVQDICLRAEIAQGTFYQYFPDRDQLLSSLLSDFVAFLRSRTMEATRARDGHADSVELSTRAYCRLFEQNRGLMKCLLNHYEAFPDAKKILQALNTAWIETVVSSIKKKRKGLSGKKTSDRDLRKRCYALGGMVDQYLAYIYLYEDKDVADVAGDLDDVVATLTFIWNQAFAKEFSA